MPPRRQAAAGAATAKTATKKSEPQKSPTSKAVNGVSRRKSPTPAKTALKTAASKTELPNGDKSTGTAASSKTTVAKATAVKAKPASKTTEARKEADDILPSTKKDAAKSRGRRATSEVKDQQAAVSKKLQGEDTVNGVTNGKKRKAPENEAAEGPGTAAAKKGKAVKPKAIINKAPTQVLHVFNFGTGDTGGELGLGPQVRTVKRPRLNPHLPAGQVGVVQVACGGMHCAALTNQNRIYTWGVNDHGALGRKTEWEGGMKDMDGEDTDSDDAEMNPYESTPTPIDNSMFPEGTVFTQVACSDSSTFAVTDEGLVWGWGTFKSSEGVIGFSPSELIQTKPVLISNLKNVTKIVCGGNHVLALNTKGSVFAWGSGEKNQLGRRIVERTRANGLVPREFGLPKGITDISAGSYHNFATHEKSGKVYAWGLNNFGQTGVTQGAGEDDAVVLHPTVLGALSAKGKGAVTSLDGGEHHSIAVQADGACLTWGRVDGFQCGIELDTLPESSIVKDERGHVRILTAPTRVPGFEAAYAACGARHSIAVSTDGKAYSWGTNNTFQCGVGNDEDVEVAEWIDNTALRGKKVVWAGASAQFSAVAADAEDVPMVNGI